MVVQACKYHMYPRGVGRKQGSEVKHNLRLAASHHVKHYAGHFV